MNNLWARTWDAVTNGVLLFLAILVATVMGAVGLMVAAAIPIGIFVVLVALARLLWRLA